MTSELSGLMPLRIAAVVKNTAAICGGCNEHEGSQEPHMQPRMRFDLLAYMPVLEGDIPVPDEFKGNERTPPTEMKTMRVANRELARTLFYN